MINLLSLKVLIQKHFKSIIIFLGFFFICITVGLLCQLEDWQVFITRNAFDHSNGLSDTNRYALLALYLAGKIPSTDEIQFFMGNWTPAFPFIISLILRLTGEAYYLIKLLCLCCIFLAAAFTSIFNTLIFIKNNYLRFFLIGGLLLLPNLRYWCFSEGYSLSEPYTLSIFILFWNYLFSYKGDSKKNQLILLSVLLLLIGYLRAATAFMTEVSIYLSLAVCGGFLLFNRFLKSYYQLESPKLKSHTAVAQSLFKSITYIFLAYTLVTFPWKIKNKIQHGAFSMGANSDASFDANWLKDSEVPSYMHTANAACHSDDILCEVVRTNLTNHHEYIKPLTIFTLIRKPFKWAEYKIKNFTWIWMGIDPHPNLGFYWISHFLEGLFYIVCFIFGYKNLSKVFSINVTKYIGLKIYIINFIIAHLIILTFAHYENRYALYLRFFCVWLALFSYSEKNKVLSN